MNKDTVLNNEQQLPDGKRIKEIRSWKSMNTLYREVLVTPIGKQSYRNIVKTPLFLGVSS